MEEIDPVKIDALERVDTESVLTDDVNVQKRNVRATLLNFLKRYSALVIILSAVALFTLTFVAIAVSSGRSTVRKNKELLSKEFEKLEFNNFVTIKDQKDEDYAKLVAEVLYKVAVQFDPKEEAMLYSVYNQFNKDYQRAHTSYKHKRTAYTNFRTNYNAINEHNQKPDIAFRMHMNSFGDMTGKEFLKKFTRKVKLDLPKNRAPEYRNDRPMSIDLRTHGYLTPAKLQGEGDLAWSYSTVAVAEAFVKRNSRETVSLSEKQLVDCVQNKANNPLMGYKYVKDLGLYETKLVEKATTKCPNLDAKRYKVASYSYSYSPDLIALLLNAGPLTVPVAISEEWQFYSEGTMNVCGAELNHFATLVGVGFDERGNHWILKNSFGEEWGTKGYAMLERNSHDYEYDCGLTSFAVYAI